MGIVFHSRPHGRARRRSLARPDQFATGQARFQIISQAISGNDFNLIWVVQRNAQKFSAFLPGQIICVLASSHPARGADRDRHGRWDGMRWTWMRLDECAEADGEVVWS
jgi:hypothetical protein